MIFEVNPTELENKIPQRPPIIQEDSFRYDSFGNGEVLLKKKRIICRLWAGTVGMRLAVIIQKLLQRLWQTNSLNLGLMNLAINISFWMMVVIIQNE